MGKVGTALLSVYNKEGLVDFALGLCGLGVNLLSTGGTYALLKKGLVTVREVSSHTGFPEILGGRVKTLHPSIHGGILARRSDPAHQEEMARLGIAPIDLVVVNLYPFRETVANPNVTLEDAIENIDIGGPTLLRAAAKNYTDVIVIVDPKDYPDLLAAIAQGEVPESKRLALAAKAFAHTAHYDTVVASYLSGLAKDSEPFPESVTLTYRKSQSLRYGENPHQQAAFYKEVETGSGRRGGWADANLLWGKEMSFNNFLDADAAVALANEFETPAAVIVKHNNPCGVATGENLLTAYQRARATDPISAFGGVVAFNRPITIAVAEAITSTFMEVVVAPSVPPEVLPLFKKKKDLRVLEVSLASSASLDLRKISGGLLVQEPNRILLAPRKELKVVTKRAPTENEMNALLLAWKVCKHVKSNAIVLANEEQTIGIGAGQMSRVDSVQIALTKAADPVVGMVMASDAFFPFRDGIDAAGKAGITAIIQPGGSIRDAEVIAAADEYNIAMVLTGTRHFRH
jgi:phosphoribosylaminoimidazolecarboxamide formyltransferase/IMP cyclohydrolase